MKSDNDLPSLISLVGVDGCGKTTLSDWLENILASKGAQVARVWSRFRNYLSKPILGLARLTGHNYYRNIEGRTFGFHSFEGLPVYRELFALFQAVDVNLAAYWYIRRVLKKYDVVICERCPWDTLVDVTSDTGLAWLPESMLGSFYTRFIEYEAKVLWIARSHDNILRTRPELVHDPKLNYRINIYQQLADKHGWDIVDNNGSLDKSRFQLSSALGMNNYSLK